MYAKQSDVGTDRGGVVYALCSKVHVETKWVTQPTMQVHLANDALLKKTPFFFLKLISREGC